MKENRGLGLFNVLYLAQTFVSDRFFLKKNVNCTGKKNFLYFIETCVRTQKNNLFFSQSGFTIEKERGEISCMTFPWT